MASDFMTFLVQFSLNKYSQACKVVAFRRMHWYCRVVINQSTLIINNNVLTFSMHHVLLS